MSEITRPERVLYFLLPGRLVCTRGVGRSFIRDVDNLSCLNLMAAITIQIGKDEANDWKNIVCAKLGF